MNQTHKSSMNAGLNDNGGEEGNGKPALKTFISIFLALVAASIVE